MNAGSFALHPALTAALLVAALALLLFAVSPALAQHLLFFPPAHDPGSPPTVASVPGEEVRLETADGVTLHGWWYPAPERPADEHPAHERSSPEAGERPAPAVLALHGNASSIAGWPPVAGEYLERGVSVLLLSYRGYGRSEGRPTLDGVPLDARAGIDFLVEQTGDPARVVVHGRSLGGAVGLASLATPGPAPGGFILESTFTSLTGMARAVYPILPSPLLFRLRGRLDALDQLRDYHGPVFVIHGARDRIVPVEMGQTLHEAAPDPKGLWVVPEADHNDLHFVAGAEYGRRIADFVLNVAQRD
jgi:uncharacterized protein